MSFRPKAFRLGKMRERILIERPVTDSSTGQPDRSWLTRYADEPASFDPANGTETVRGRQVEAGIKAVFLTRYRPDVSVEDRITRKGSTYGIVAVLPAQGGRRYQELHVKSLRPQDDSTFVGTTGIGSLTAALSGLDAYGFGPIEMTEDGYAYALRIYNSGTAGSCRLALYSHNSVLTRPDEPLAESLEFELVDGWNEQPIPTVWLASGTEVWVVLLTDTGVTPSLRYDVGSGQRHLRDAITYPNFPNPFGSGSTQLSVDYSVAVSYLGT